MQFLKTTLIVLMSIFCSSGIIGQDVSFASKVFEYKPAPGQFINTVFGYPNSAQNVIGQNSGGVSLGGFGGYIVIGFDKPIENHIDNPYGIDFTIFGNASSSSSEPGLVYVMKDENANGLPDDIWYLLAGSDYWFSKTITDYEITYHNPGDTVATDIIWNDNLGNSGIIPANEYHQQPYYPNTDSFPDISFEKYVLNGVLIGDRLDKSNSSFITSNQFPFGYADNRPKNMNYSGWEPDNPYSNSIEGIGGDGFDISWAIDMDDNYIEIDKIDFIKIQTGVNAIAGWLGEISTEVLLLVDIAPDKSIVGTDKMVVIEPVNNDVNKNSEIELNAFAYLNGRVQNNANFTWWSGNSEVATVNEFGVLHGVNPGTCFIYVQWQMHTYLVDSIEINITNPIFVKETELNSLILYPNPVDNVITISYSSKISSYSIKNSIGKTITESELNSNTILVNDLIPGIYFIEFYGLESTICKRIIKR